MDSKFLKVIILAAVADGQIQSQEVEMMKHLKTYHPQLKDIPDNKIQEIAIDIYNKCSSGMEAKHILDQLGEQLTAEERNSAYALAKEVCAADFNLLSAEDEFLKMLEEHWEISKSTVAAINRSISLRYFS